MIQLISKKEEEDKYKALRSVVRKVAKVKHPDNNQTNICQFRFLLYSL